MHTVYINNNEKQEMSPFVNLTRQTSGILWLLESRPQLVRMLPLFWPPFLEKGPPKITEGGPLGPYWLFSRINPELMQESLLEVTFAWCFLPAQLSLNTKRDCLKLTVVSFLCSHKNSKLFRCSFTEATGSPM